MLSPGDRVLGPNMSEREDPGKLLSYWEDQIQIVVSQKCKESPVYEVNPEHGTGRGGNHRNMLRTVGGQNLQFQHRKSHKEERKLRKHRSTQRV